MVFPTIHDWFIFLALEITCCYQIHMQAYVISITHMEAPSASKNTHQSLHPDNNKYCLYTDVPEGMSWHSGTPHRLTIDNLKLSHSISVMCAVEGTAGSVYYRSSLIVYGE